MAMHSERGALGTGADVDKKGKWGSQKFFIKSRANAKADASALGAAISTLCPADGNCPVGDTFFMLQTTVFRPCFACGLSFCAFG